MTQAVARPSGEMNAVAQNKDAALNERIALTSDILLMVLSSKRDEVKALLSGMNSVELNAAFKRAQIATKAAGPNVVDQYIKAGEAVLASPRVV